MKAITIIQPWATLIAIGEKKFETRSWATKHRGPLAIHAGKRVDKEECMREPFKFVLAKHGYTADNLPTGAIVALSNMTNCYKVSRSSGEDGPVWLDIEGRTLCWAGKLLQEYYFGDYSDGRFAWEQAGVRQIEPIPAKGQQGLWNWSESHE